MGTGNSIEGAPARVMLARAYARVYVYGNSQDSQERASIEGASDALRDAGERGPKGSSEYPQGYPSGARS